MTEDRWTRRMERYRRRAEAAERLLEDKSREIFDANHDLLLLARDLEERVAERTLELERARDQALCSSRAKSTFLANMSHELRTPLNAITGYAELLDELVVEASQPHLCGDLARIRSSALHLLALVDDVLDLSKVEAGRIQLSPEALDLDEVLRDAVTSVRGRVDGKVELLGPERCGVEVLADPTRLTQCVLNVLANAAKFTQVGEIRVVAFVRKEIVDIEVSDTGIGMTPSEVERLFSTFTQANETIRTRFGGTGLGLALSRELMERMGGQLKVVWSRPGSGSTFRLAIPRA